MWGRLEKAPLTTRSQESSPRRVKKTHTQNKNAARSTPPFSAGWFELHSVSDSVVMSCFKNIVSKMLKCWHQREIRCCFVSRTRMFFFPLLLAFVSFQQVSDHNSSSSNFPVFLQNTAIIPVFFFSFLFFNGGMVLFSCSQLLFSETENNWQQSSHNLYSTYYAYKLSLFEKDKNHLKWNLWWNLCNFYGFQNKSVRISACKINVRTTP